VRDGHGTHTQRTKARLQPCLKKYPIGYLCAESAAGSREPQRNRLGAESALADALGCTRAREREMAHGGVRVRVEIMGSQQGLES
jgi:hypothetical protein